MYQRLCIHCQNFKMFVPEMPEKQAKMLDAIKLPGLSLYPHHQIKHVRDHSENISGVAAFEGDIRFHHILPIFPGWGRGDPDFAK